MSDLEIYSPDNRMGRGDSLDHIQPGTWWRYEGEIEDLKKGWTPPEHGVILLLKDVRVVDGEIHTLVMRSHPEWGRGTFRVLLDDFLKTYSLALDGEALRQAEIDAVMATIQKRGQILSQPPGDDIFLARVLTDQRAKTEAAPETVDPSQKPSEKKVKLPAALLPSGDIEAAQKKIETAIAVMEARKNWISERTKELNDSMGLAQSYQEERIDVSLAGISEQTQKAEGMLKNVQTMRLFLGEDQFHDHLVKGEGASGDAPLHLMQRMLYLDEEMFVANCIDGFNGDMLGDLAQLLEANPVFRDRMLPYERCVAITRARRNSREFEMPETVADVFVRLQEMELDKCIQILIRDGENIHLIAADELTSRAERLFPSKAEIDAIFLKRGFRESREITVQDVEYSDRRRDHDDRALFYKRLLLILWGAHERLGVFGNFIPEGENWLSQDVHDRHFRFIHDEEQMLEDGRPTISEYLKENRAGLRPGSRVLVQWKRAIDPDSAPSVFSKVDRNYNQYLEVDLVEEFGCQIARKSGADVIVRAPVSKYSYEASKNRKFTTSVALAKTRHTHSKYQRDVGRGFICLDGVRLEDLSYYFNSRKARQDYLSYLHLFDQALRILKDEERMARPVIKSLLGDAPDADPEVLKSALATWRAGNKYDWPEKPAHLKRIADMAQILMLQTDVLVEKLSTLLPDMPLAQVKLGSNGQITCVMDDRYTLLGRVVPRSLDMSFKMTAKGDLREAGVTEGTLDQAPRSNEIVLWEDESFSWPDIFSLHPSLLEPRLKETLSQIDGSYGARDLLDWLSGENAELRCRTALESLEYQIRQANTKYVELEHLRLDIGLIFNKDSFGQRLQTITLKVDPVALSVALGQTEAVKDFVYNIYANKARVFEKLSKDIGLERSVSVMLVDVPENTPLSSSLNFDEMDWVRDLFGSYELKLPGEDVSEEDRASAYGRDIRACMINQARLSSWRAEPPYSPEKYAEKADGIEVIVSKEGAQLLKLLRGIEIDPSEILVPEMSGETDPETETPDY